MNEESTEIMIPKKRFDEINEKLKVLREENRALIAEKSTLTEIRVGLGRSEDYAGSKRDFRRGGVSKKRIRRNRLQDLMSK